MHYAPVSRQICGLGSDAEPLRNSLIRRSNSTRKLDRRYRVLLWIRRLKVRILPPQPNPPRCLKPSYLRGVASPRLYFASLAVPECIHGFTKDPVANTLNVPDHKVSYRACYNK